MTNTNKDRDGPPRVSIITAAFNAERDIARMIRSVDEQTETSWEHVIVDDGSSDTTSALINARAQRDPRVRGLRQQNAGAAAARNAGLAMAEGEWILFLDADDTLRPDFLARMLRHATSDVDAIACGHLRVTPQGKTAARRAAPRIAQGRFVDVTRGPPAILHAVLLRRSIFASIGTFDSGLRTNEDWDLWVRLARSTARIAREPRPLAMYWSTPGSLTRNGRQMLRDMTVVLERMKRPDRRVLDPRPEYADRLADPDVPSHLLIAAIWCLGANLGADDKVAECVVPVLIPPRISTLADAALEGLMIGVGAGYGGLLPAWSGVAKRLRENLGHIADAAGQPDLVEPLLAALEVEVVRTGALQRPTMVGATFALPSGQALLTLPAIPPAAKRILLKAACVRPRTLGLIAARQEDFTSRIRLFSRIARTMMYRAAQNFRVTP